MWLIFSHLHKKLLGEKAMSVSAAVLKMDGFQKPAPAPM